MAWRERRKRTGDAEGFDLRLRAADRQEARAAALSLAADLARKKERERAWEWARAADCCFWFAARR